MKRLKINIKYTAALMLVFYSGLTEISAQGVDIRAASTGKKFYIGASIFPSQSNINNNGIKALSELESSESLTFSGSFDAGISLNRNVGISTGIGYTFYSSELALTAYKDSLMDQEDLDSDIYIRRISGKDIVEIQNIGLISIPILADFAFPLNKVFGIYLQTGINFSFPVVKKFSSSGIMTYAGYYPAYNIEITGIPNQGFVEQKLSTETSTLKISFFIPVYNASGGASIALNDKTHIHLGICYNRILSGISAYSTSEQFHLSANLNEMNSMMGGSSKVTAQAVGVRFGIRYYLK